MWHGSVYRSYLDEMEDHALTSIQVLCSAMRSILDLRLVCFCIIDSNYLVEELFQISFFPIDDSILTLQLSF
jgi:hypothetical protein